MLDDAEKRAAKETADAEADIKKWPVSYQRINEATGWRGEVFPFRKFTLIAEAFIDGFLNIDTQAIEFTMHNGKTSIVRYQPARTRRAKAEEVEA